jgi:anti-anti-sigma factor
MDLRLTVRYRDDTALIVCVGRLLYGEEAASLRARVKGLIAQGAKSIVLDLAGVTYLDSGALGVLTGLHMSAPQANCFFRLVNLTPRTAKLLQTTNLTNFFDVEGSTSVPRSA